MKRKRKYWTADEVDWLVKHYPFDRAADIAETLNRPISSIYDKAARAVSAKVKPSWSRIAAVASCVVGSTRRSSPHASSQGTPPGTKA